MIIVYIIQHNSEYDRLTSWNRRLKICAWKTPELGPSDTVVTLYSSCRGSKNITQKKYLKRSYINESYKYTIAAARTTIWDSEQDESIPN